MSLTENKLLNSLMDGLDLSDCTEEEKEMFKNDIERYLNHRKERIALKNENVKNVRGIKMDRRQELMEKYITEGMLLEDFIEMIVTLEDKVNELEQQISEFHKSKPE